MAARGRRAFSAGRVLGRSFPIWGRNIVPFTILVAVVYLPLVAYGILAYPLRGVLYSWVLGFGWYLLWFIAPLAVIHGVLQQLRGEPVSVGGCLRVYLTRLVPALGAGLVVGFLGYLYMFPMAMVCFGLVVLAGAPGNVLVFAVFLPALLIGCMYWVAVPVAAAERPGILASLQRSARLTRGSRGSVFVIALVVIALQIVLWFVARIGLRVAGPLGAWVTLFLTLVLSGYGAVVTAVTYHDLRSAKEGVGVDDLVRVFA